MIPVHLKLNMFNAQTENICLLFFSSICVFKLKYFNNYKNAMGKYNKGDSYKNFRSTSLRQMSET